MAKSIRELRETRGNALKLARDISEAADGAKRSMNEDEQRQFGAYMDDVTRIGVEIQNEERLLDAEREFALEGLPKKSKEEEARSGSDPASELRSRAFKRLLTYGMDEMPLDERRALTAGSDVQGGFLGAPQEFVKELIAAQKNNVFLRKLAKMYQCTSNEGIGAPTLDVDADDAEWTTEIKRITEDDIMRFGKREIKPHPLKKRILISDKQLRSEIMDTEAIVMDRIAYKYGITEEKAFLTGSGDQQPLGLFTASANGINTDRDVTLAYADDFSADDILTTKYSLKGQYMEKAG